MVDFLEGSMATWRWPSSDEILTVCLFLKSYPFKSMVTGKLLPGAANTQPQWLIMFAILLKLIWKRWNWRRTSISNFKGGRKFSWAVLIVAFFVIWAVYIFSMFVCDEQCLICQYWLIFQWKESLTLILDTN